MRHWNLPPYENDDNPHDMRGCAWLFVVALLFYVIVGIVVGVAVFS